MTPAAGWVPRGRASSTAVLPRAGGGVRVPGAAPLLVGLALVAAVLAAVSLGTPTIAPARLGAVLADDASIEHVVLRELRLPRVVLALLGGAAVGVAGLLLQEGLRNPLAVPELLGVSTGAALAVSVTVV